MLIQIFQGLLAFVATLAIGHLLIKKAVNWGFIDVPDARKVHNLPTPRTGGIAMLLGLTLTSGFLTLFGWPIPHLPWQTWVSGFGFAFSGALDDRFNFAPKQKFWFLLLLSALAAWPWAARAAQAGFQGVWVGSYVLHVPPVALFALLTLWFMSMPNAVNIEDAINGYMGGFTLILMTFVLMRGGNTQLILGALTAFLLLNWPKAKHFMGDAGSLGCGFLLAESLLWRGGMEHPVQALIWTAPISMDVAMGIIRRKRLGMSLFEADRFTCPHHLLGRFNGSHAKATLVLWLILIVLLILSKFPMASILWLLGYALLLVYLNARLLFRQTKTTAP